MSHEANEEGASLDRRGFLKCMAWAGTGLVWSLSGGVLRSYALGAPAEHGGDFHFVQFSDSHIGFSKAPNTDVTATLKEAVDAVNALPFTPDFLIHTGDVTHLSKAEEFDTAEQVLRHGKVKQAFYVPGEHDGMDDGRKLYLERHGKGTKGAGWYSFDHKGVHFVGLVNALTMDNAGLGVLGAEQLAWLKADLQPRSAGTPIVVFAHVPLWSVYPAWGWGTADSEQALAYLKRFGSVTVLNGHIHQTMQKVEGHVTFHTAASTAFPQPAPGQADHAGPMPVAPGKLRSLLGITKVAYVTHDHTLAIVDSALAAPASAR